jgi:excisionase family DNA binding protein
MSTSLAENALWTAAEAAAYLRVSRSLIYKLEQEGTLPCLRIGACVRFDPATVRAFARGEVVRRPAELAAVGARRG